MNGQSLFTDEGFVKFSIYNWKDGKIPTEEYEWHISGYGFSAVDPQRSYQCEIKCIDYQ